MSTAIINQRLYGDGAECREQSKMTAPKKLAPASAPALLRVLPTHMIPLHPNYDRARTTFLRAELRATTTTKMGHWFRRKRDSSPACFCAVKVDDVMLPTDDDFAELDATVRELAKLQRMRQGTSLWDCYGAVDRHYPGLKLLRQIYQFVDRATKEIPPRPLEQIMRIRDGGGEHGKLAAKFLDCSLDIRQGERDVTSVVWDEFTPLFRRYRSDDPRGPGRRAEALLKTMIANANGNPELIAYAVFMEIEREDRLWVRNYFAGVHALQSWIEDDLQSAELLHKVSDFFVPAITPAEREGWFNEDRESARRRKVAERKRRERAKKIRRKA
jgi:hypothetical protein